MDKDHFEKRGGCFTPKSVIGPIVKKRTVSPSGFPGPRGFSGWCVILSAISYLTANRGPVLMAPVKVENCQSSHVCGVSN